MAGPVESHRPGALCLERHAVHDDALDDGIGPTPVGEVGLTLVEVVVAVLLLTLVTTASLPAAAAALRAIRDAPVLVEATRVAEQELEAARATPCAQLPWSTPTAGSRSGADPAAWSVTGTAVPVSFSGEPRRRWRTGDTTQADACAVDREGRPSGTAPYQYETTVRSVERPDVSITLVTSLFQGAVR